MDYKYEQALERAQKLQENSNGMILKKWLWRVFPELKENEDERIRKEIIDFLGLPHPQFVGKRDHEKWIAWLEKQGKNKPAENVEIRFCEGDKVVSNQDGNLYTVGTEYYITGDNICLHDTDGNHLWTNRDDLEKNYHLWTLKDAKDGDVLASKGKGGQEIGIVKKFIGKYGGHNKCFETYCYSDLDGTFRIGEYMGGNTIHPATKKQCDLLFQRMKEAGYEWDADKKELKTIEQNPAESTKDYNDIDPHFGILVEDLMSADKVEPKFKPGDCIVFNGPILYIDEVVNGYYRTTSIGDGIHNSYDWNIDNAARLWTIQEVKDGDVLVDEDNNIGIYVGKMDDFWHSCIYLGCDSCLREIGGYHNIKNTKPATKEQRYLLFQKMKEAGYKWDADKKELKKIEVVSKESEDERIRNFLIDFIKVCTWTEKKDQGWPSREDCLAWLEKQGEKKPADKVEPKFHEDDWIIATGEVVYQIKDIQGTNVTLVESNGDESIFDISVLDNAKLWTIADAKDGDVLVNGSNIFIFHFINGTRLMGYCHVNVDDNKFYIDNAFDTSFFDTSFGTIDAEFTVASKEQRDLLFQKMKEAGYEWDSDKKELKKIEPKKIDADKVIAWLVANICDFEYYVKRFKEDFGL